MVPGLLRRPTPTTDTLGIVAALNWQAQMSQGGGSDHNGFPVSQLKLLWALCMLQWWKALVLARPTRAYQRKLCL